LPEATDVSSKLAAAATYLGLMTLVVYGAMNRGDPDFGVWMLAPLVFVQFAAGFFVGRWWAILLPLLVVVISVPAGYPPDPHGEGFPLWFGLAFLSVFAIPLVGLAVWGRKLYDRELVASR
jgi:hypothetical protein